MARQKPNEIEEEVKKQNASDYGDEELGGHDTQSADNVEEGMEDYSGEKLKWNDERDLKDIIDEDEKELSGLPEDADI